MDRFQFKDEIVRCECSNCFTEHDIDNMQQIDEKYFCDVSCAAEHVAENIDDYIERLLD